MWKSSSRLQSKKKVQLYPEGVSSRANTYVMINFVCPMSFMMVMQFNDGSILHKSIAKLFSSFKIPFYILFTINCNSQNLCVRVRTMYVQRSTCQCLFRITCKLKRTILYKIQLFHLRATHGTSIKMINKWNWRPYFFFFLRYAWTKRMPAAIWLAFIEAKIVWFRSR